MIWNNVLYGFGLSLTYKIWITHKPKPIIWILDHSLCHSKYFDLYFSTKIFRSIQNIEKTWTMSMIFKNILSGNWFTFMIYLLFWCASSNYSIEKIIYHKFHICDLYVHYEMYGDVSPMLVMQWITYHNLYICCLCGLDELYGCISLTFLLKKMICHKIHICDLCSLHELYE